MTAKRVYVLVAVNVLYIILLAFCAYRIRAVHPQDFTAMRSKIEAAPSLEDLRRRALLAISALESSDRAIISFHELAIRMVSLGITWGVMNSLLLCVLMRHPPQI